MKTPPGFDPFPKHHVPDVTNENDIVWDEMQSPSAKFHIFEKEISYAMRDELEPSAGGETPPFEVALARVPPGAANWPRHVHLMQWEYYIILSGTGKVVRNDQERSIKAGDHIMEPPGVAHHMVNTGDEDLVYYVIANNTSSDMYYYPDSDKWGVSSARGYFRFDKTTTYWDGEDDAGSGER